MPLTAENELALANLHTSPLWLGVQAAVRELAAEAHQSMLEESVQPVRAPHRLDQWVGNEIGLLNFLTVTAAASAQVRAATNPTNEPSTHAGNADAESQPSVPPMP